MKKMQISVDTGAVQVDVADQSGKKIGEFEIIPTDVNILKRYKSVEKFFSDVHFEEKPTDDEVVNFSEDIEKQFNYLFDYDVSAGLFARCSPLTVVAGGKVFFEDVFEKLGDAIEKVFDERLKEKEERVEKAVEAYGA